MGPNPCDQCPYQKREEPREDRPAGRQPCDDGRGWSCAAASRGTMSSKDGGRTRSGMRPGVSQGLRDRQALPALWFQTSAPEQGAKALLLC